MSTVTAAQTPSTAISEIVGPAPSPATNPALRPFRRVSVAAACALSLLALSFEARAERVSLLGFHGDKATALRWRVAQILKRAGHVVLGYKPPDPDSPGELQAYARRRRVDAFVSGEADEGRDGWELTLTVRDAAGEPTGSPLTFEARNLRRLVKYMKADGQDRLDAVVRGRTEARGVVDLDARAGASDAAGGAPRAWDADEFEPTRQKTKSKKKRRRRAAEPAPEATEAAFDADAPSGVDSDASIFDADAGESSESSSDGEESERQSRPLFAGPGAASEELSSDEVGFDESPDDEAAGEGSEARLPTLVAGVNAGVVRRSLGYVDDLYGRARTPQTNAWVYQLHVALYPFARPAKDRIALIASYESVFSGKVRDSEVDEDFPVTFSELYAGLRYRQPLGKHEVGVQGTFGKLSSGLDDPDGAARVPEYDYTLLRGGVDVGLRFGAVTVRGAAGYRLPVGGYGEVSSPEWYPRAKAYGYDGLLGLEYRFSDEVGFELNGTVRRFVMQMNSEPEDARGGVAEVAGGAVDMYTSGYFGLFVTL